MFIFRNHNVKSIIFRQVNFLSCWSCKKDINDLLYNLFCSNCKALQKPDSKTNYFQILKVNETYDQDENELSKNYKNLQKFLHPDKFANRDKNEQEISAMYSSLVNEAYNTLLEPLARGIYMLKLKGQNIPENTEVVDQEFLMEIMEKNEEVESAETEEEIIKLNEENKRAIKDLTKQVSKAFSNGDIQKVVKILSVLKYYTSIENQIQSVIRSKGIIQ